MPNLFSYVAQHGHHKYDRYFPFYDDCLRDLREHPDLRLLEIGCSADSLKMWRDCFDLWEVTGLDECPRGPTNQDDLAYIPDVVYVEGSQTDLALLDRLGAFDVVIDDASHRPDDQVITFDFLFPRMNSGGWYFIEDLHTSFWPDYGEGSTLEFAQEIIDDIHAPWAHEQRAWPIAELRIIDSLLGVRRE